MRADETARDGFRYFHFVMAAFGAILLLSNVIGDVLTEVYGYGRARRCVWVGFAAVLFMTLMSGVVVALPPAPGWTGQAAYEQVFGQVPRIVLASVAAFWSGELVNAFVMARMKVAAKGRHLWSRTIGSTVVGQAVDSAIFYPLAFPGVWDASTVVSVMIGNWALKAAWEVLLTPVTYHATEPQRSSRSAGTSSGCLAERHGSRSVGRTPPRLRRSHGPSTS